MSSCQAVADHSPQTTTITNTVTATLNDICGTESTIPGGHTVTAAQPIETIVHFDYDANAYSCCLDCLIQLKGGDCAAWAVVPGVSCTILGSPAVYRGPRCADGLLNGTIGVNLAKYPDALAALGPCAGTVKTVQD